MREPIQPKTSGNGGGTEELPDSAELETPVPSGKGREPTTYMRAHDFWRAAKAYQPRTATDYQLYRRWPIIDRRLVGEKKTVLDIQKEMDERYIREHWGSGEYKVFFHDANRKGNTEVCRTLIRMDDTAFPPVVDQRELVVGHPRNIGYIEGLKARGAWQRDMADNKSDSAAVAAEVVGLAKDVIAKHQERPPAQVPGVAETMSMMASGFKTLLENAVSPFDQLLKAKQVFGSDPALITLLTKQQERIEALMEKVFDLKAPPAAAETGGPAGFVAQANQVLDLLDRFRERQVSVESPWSGMLIELVRGLSPLVVPFVLARMKLPAPAGGASAAGPPAAAAPPPSAVPAAAADSGGAAAASAIPKEGKGAGMFGIPEAFVVVSQEAVQAFNLGIGGDSFAEAVVKRHGEAAYSAIALLGRDAILKAVSFYPQVAERIGARMPEVEEFIDDFLQYGREPDGEGEGDEE